MQAINSASVAANGLSPACRGLLVALVTACIVPAASAGDLSPFAAPQVQRAPMLQEAPAPSMSAAQRKFYADFKREMSTLPSARRNALKADFERKRDAASAIDEKTHYQRLVVILSEM